jgi:hypothetical protein
MAEVVQESETEAFAAGPRRRPRSGPSAHRVLDRVDENDQIGIRRLLELVHDHQEAAATRLSRQLGRRNEQSSEFVAVDRPRRRRPAGRGRRRRVRPLAPRRDLACRNGWATKRMKGR